MANKVGNAIKKARTDADLTQEQLAKKISGISASDISKAERGELELTQAVLKEIAKITGVTQKSLLDAAASSSYKKSASSSAKKTSGTAKKTSSSKTSSSSGTSMKVTATEKKLVELYRDADSDTKKKVMSLLKGEATGVEDILQNVLGGMGNLFKDK